MQKLSSQWKRQGRRIALVPTMGCLHDGHLSLVREARRRAGRTGKVVVSIFVNPTQFGPTEDLSGYPRNFSRDARLCRAADADVIFHPSTTGMYPRRAEGFSTYVVEEKFSGRLEGISRPTHFRGVTTVVAKLFHIVNPEVAIFGAKDFQQAFIIQKMVSDLNFAVKIIVAPTRREKDGLAMSSRNRYLTSEQRKEAAILWEIISELRHELRQRPSIGSVSKWKARIASRIRQRPSCRLDYAEFFDPRTMDPVSEVKRGVHFALAVFVGKTRLIDNADLSL